MQRPRAKHARHVCAAAAALWKWTGSDTYQTEAMAYWNNKGPGDQASTEFFYYYNWCSPASLLSANAARAPVAMPIQARVAAGLCSAHALSRHRTDLHGARLQGARVACATGIGSRT